MWPSLAVLDSTEQPSLARLKEQLKKDAESIGVAAVKYFDLRQNRNSDYRHGGDGYYSG